MLLLRPEASLLETALQRAIVDRQGTTLFVTGEPGVGKSTFVEHFMQKWDNIAIPLRIIYSRSLPVIFRSEVTLRSARQDHPDGRFHIVLIAYGSVTRMTSS